MESNKIKADANKFAEWLETRLIKSQTRAKDFAETIGIPKSTISNMISKQELPSEEKFQKICNGFGISKTKALKEIAATKCRKYV